MTLDTKRGILYVPTGSAAFDFYGADRLGEDLFANCLLALNAETGQRLWHFQAVKHDLWDRDFPSPPVLLTVNHERQTNRCRSADFQARLRLSLRSHKRHSAISAGVAAHTRPATCQVKSPPRSKVFPLNPRRPPFSRQALTEDLLTNRTPEVHQWALEKFHAFRNRRPVSSVHRRQRHRRLPPDSMAARNGVVPPSTPKPTSSTSMPTTSPGPALLPKKKMQLARALSI